jgi:hypothetical protein
LSKNAIELIESGGNSDTKARHAFQYAALVGLRLKLTLMLAEPEETLGNFFIRNCFALHKISDALLMVNKAVAALTSTRDKYGDFVYVLSKIRESYKISQTKMSGR